MAGVLNYRRPCHRNYECEECELYQALQGFGLGEEAGVGKPSTQARESGVGDRLGEGVLDEMVSAYIVQLTEGCDVVHHLAAAFRRIDLPKEVYWEVNVNGTRYLLEAASKHGVKKFVYCSTCGVHGNVDHPPAADLLIGHRLCKSHVLTGQGGEFQSAIGPYRKVLCALHGQADTGRIGAGGKVEQLFHIAPMGPQLRANAGGRSAQADPGIGRHLGVPFGSIVC